MTQLADRPGASGAPARTDPDKRIAVAHVEGRLSEAPDVAPVPPLRERDWRLGTHFMVRIGGLAIDAVHGFRYPNLVAWAEEMLDAQDFVTAESQRVVAMLHEAAQTLDETQRKDVVWLHRQLNRGKSTDGPRAAAALAVLDVADPVLAREVRGVLVHRTMTAGRRRDAEAVMGTDAAAARECLRELAGDDRVRQALLLASPTVNGYVDAYLDGSLRDKRARRLERSLLEYLYRMACKPTPFSRFTGVGLGSFADEADGAPEDGHFAIGERWRSFPRINVSLLTRIAALVTEHRTLRRDLALALTPGWSVQEGSVRFVRRSVQVGATENTVSFDAVDDSVFVVSRSNVLEAVFEMFGTERTLVWGDLARELALSIGGEKSDFDDYIAILVRLGLLRVPALAIDIHSGDPLEAFYRSTGSLGPTIADLLLAPLSDLLDAVGRYPRADAAGRGDLLEVIRQRFLDMAAALGSPDEPVPKTVLFEDVRVDNDAIEWGQKTWRDSVGRSLARFEQMLPAFNSTLAHRLVLKGFFLARYGPGARCDDLVKFVSDFNEDLFDQYLQVSSRRRAFGPDGTFYPQINWLYQNELVALDRGRFAFAAQLRQRVEAMADDADEIEIDEAFIAKVTDELTDIAVDVAPRAHFLQMAEQDGHPVGVLNRIYGGLRFPFSRFTHCFDDIDGGSLSRQLRTGLSDIEPDDAIFAEVTGGQASTNLNLHGRLVDREIICPGEWSSTPASRQLEFGQLYVEHDIEQDRLVLRDKKSGREVLPVYLGYLVPIALSEVPRTLLLFSQSSTMVFDPWSGVAGRHEGADGAVLHRPRLRLGDVYLARRSWTTAGSALPVLAKGVGETDWFLGWRRWRRENGLPAQVFARVHNADGPDEQLGDFARTHGDKPQYVDFDSPLSLRLLEQRMEGEFTSVLFEEVLPAEDGLYVTSGEGRHVAEMVVETASLKPGVVTVDADSADAAAGEL